MNIEPPLSPLALQPRARRGSSARIPAPHVITAVGWLTTAGANLGLGLWFRHPNTLGLSLWPVTTLLCIVAAAGLLRGAKWARILVSVLAVVGGLFVATLSLAAFYPTEIFWWPGALFVVFCAWTLLFTLGLWPDYARPESSAA